LPIILEKSLNVGTNLHWIRVKGRESNSSEVDKMNKVYKYLLSLVAVIIIIFGYVQYKHASTENAVRDYLFVSEGLSMDSVETDPFIANLQGHKNWMVSVKIEGDPKTYYYFVNDEEQVVLESYVENGVENVQH